MGVRIIFDFPSEDSFLGPEPVTIPGRKISEMSETNSVSFTPLPLLEFAPALLWHGDHQASAKLNYAEKVERITQYKPVTLELIEKLSSDIKDHFETRLQNDFALFVQVYKTNIVYREHQTQHQVGQAAGSNATYAGAHECTFPNLACCHNAAADDTEHMFAYESESYMNRNATAIVPTPVNKVDTAMEATMRRQGIRILNELSNPETALTPKEAFKTYLESMRLQLERQDKETDDPITHKIIQDYLSVIRAYIKFINNQDLDNMVHKMTYSYDKQPCVDGQFYKNVQSTMNEKLSLEMDEAEIKYMRAMNDETDIVGVQKDYIKHCLQSLEVQTLVRDYFQTTSQEVWVSDKKKAHDPKLSVSKVGTVGFSEKMRRVFDTCIQAIRSFGTKSWIVPKKLNVIFPRILKEIMKEPMPPKEKLQSIPVVTNAVVTRSMTAQPQALTAAAPVVQKLSPTMRRYVRASIDSPKVKQIAQDYFSTVPQSTQQADAKRAADKKLTVGKVNNVGFSSKMVTLFGASVDAIREDTKSTVTPKNMHVFFPKIVEQLALQRS